MKLLINPQNQINLICFEDVKNNDPIIELEIYFFIKNT